MGGFWETRRRRRRKRKRRPGFLLLSKKKDKMSSRPAGPGQRSRPSVLPSQSSAPHWCAGGRLAEGGKREAAFGPPLVTTASPGGLPNSSVSDPHCEAGQRRAAPATPPGGNKCASASGAETIASISVNRQIPKQCGEIIWTCVGAQKCGQNEKWPRSGFFALRHCAAPASCALATRGQCHDQARARDGGGGTSPPLTKLQQYEWFFAEDKDDVHVSIFEIACQECTNGAILRVSS